MASPSPAATVTLAPPLRVCAPAPRTINMDRVAANLSSKVVHIQTGPAGGHQVYVIHYDLLLSVSSFFSVALATEDRTSESGHGRGDDNEEEEEEEEERGGAVIDFKLDAADVAEFRYFNEWLYTRRLSFIRLDLAKTSAKRTEKATGNQLVMARLWLFGEKYGVPLFKNYVLSAWLNTVRCENVYECSTFNLVWAKTAAGSAVRRFIVDYLVLCSDPRRLPQGLLGEIVRAALERAWPLIRGEEVVDADLWQRETCAKYHEHAVGERCSL